VIQVYAFHFITYFPCILHVSVLENRLGDSANGLQEVPKIWKNHNLGHIKFILPTAPQRPVTLNMGHLMNGWYDVIKLNERANDPNTGIEDSCKYIQSLIEEELNKTGLPLSRIALAGFSQGGAMSLFTGLQEKYLPTSSEQPSQRLAGLLVMSGYLPKASAFKLSESLKETPVLHCHGSDDQIVSFILYLPTAIFLRIDSGLLFHIL
jgi:predicted esterase